MRVTKSLIITGTDRKEGIYVTAITGINIPVIAKTMRTVAQSAQEVPQTYSLSQGLLLLAPAAEDALQVRFHASRPCRLVALDSFFAMLDFQVTGLVPLDLRDVTTLLRVRVPKRVFEVVSKADIPNSRKNVFVRWVGNTG